MIYVFGGTKSRKAAAISVFLISAVVHEYVLVCSFRFLYPLLLLMFGGIGSKSFLTFKLIIINVAQLLAYRHVFNYHMKDTKVFSVVHFSFWVARLQYIGLIDILRNMFLLPIKMPVMK